MPVPRIAVEGPMGNKELQVGYFVPQFAILFNGSRKPPEHGG